MSNNEKRCRIFPPYFTRFYKNHLIDIISNFYMAFPNNCRNSIISQNWAVLAHLRQLVLFWKIRIRSCVVLQMELPKSLWHHFCIAFPNNCGNSITYLTELSTPLPDRAIKPGFSCPAIIQLAEAQLGLYKTFKPMGTFLTRSPHITSQLIV